MEMSERLKFH